MYIIIHQFIYKIKCLQSYNLYKKWRGKNYKPNSPSTPNNVEITRTGCVAQATFKKFKLFPNTEAMLLSFLKNFYPALRVLATVRGGCRWQSNTAGSSCFHFSIFIKTKTEKHFHCFIMNAKSYSFQLSVEERQVEETLLSLLHTILFHRTMGKFTYQQEGSYTIGTIGSLDVDCETMDLTYVRCNSRILDQNLRKQVVNFKETLRSNIGAGCGNVNLEFYQKKKKGWPFGIEFISWEIWNFTLNISRLKSEQRQRFRERVGESISEKILEIAQAINRPDYVPKMPNQSDLGNVFETTYSDVQPYLHKITSQISNDASASVGSTMRKLIRDTFSYWVQKNLDRI